MNNKRWISYVRNSSINPVLGIWRRVFSQGHKERIFENFRLGSMVFVSWPTTSRWTTCAPRPIWRSTGSACGWRRRSTAKCRCAPSPRPSPPARPRNSSTKPWQSAACPMERWIWTFWSPSAPATALFHSMGSASEIDIQCSLCRKKLLRRSHIALWVMIHWLDTKPYISNYVSAPKVRFWTPLTTESRQSTLIC